MKKERCGACKFLKFEDAEGFGLCSLLEEADVHCQDEACVEYVKNEIEEVDYE